MVATISPAELKQKPSHEIDLIDVRTPAEFQEVHIEFARNIPLDQLKPEVIRSQKTGEANMPVYFICRSGSRGRMACEKLSTAGMENVVNVEGGTEAAVEAGLPVVRGKKVMSLERQVRILAGFLVFVGSVLGFALSPYWLVLPAFIGAGLVYAGISDTCGMGMMLAKMPWNQACKTK